LVNYLDKKFRHFINYNLIIYSLHNGKKINRIIYAQLGV